MSHFSTTRVSLWLRLAFVLVAPLAATAQTPDDWPQLRGRNVDGVSVASGVFPEGQSTTLDLAWSQPLGSGYSGVSVAGGLAVTMFTDGESNILIAFDAETGRERWRLPYGLIYKGHDGSYDGPISTPLIDGNLTFALGPSGRFFAVDNLDGEIVWSTDLVEDLDTPVPLYGYATSPMLMDGVIILQVGSPGGTVVGFEPETGERLWSLGSDSVNAQTPVPMTVNGRRQLLASGDQQLLGVDPASGQLLWSVPHHGANMRGAFTMVPVTAGEDRVFLRYKDHESTLFDFAGGTEAPRTPWVARTIRNTHSVGVYHDGYLYGFSSRFLTSVDAASGKAAWKSRPPGDGFLALVDGHLLILTKNGSVHVVKATPESYQEITSLQVFDELAWTPPSFANGSLFVRSLGAIAKVDLRNASEPETTDALASATNAVPAGDFAGFLEEVRAADDKASIIDAYLERQPSLPIVEGNETVHFVYRGEATDVAVAGDMFGARQERPMARVEGTDLFHYSTELIPGTRISYVFLKDYQDAVPDPLNPSMAQWADVLGEDIRLQATTGGSPLDVSSLAMPGFETPSHLLEPSAKTRRGTFESHELHSDAMNRPHTIQVYLPAGYEDGLERYPVVYFHGGTNATKLGQLTHTLDNLIGRSLQRVIVVLIDLRAGHLFVQRDTYGEFWSEELVPFIDETYRTVSSREGRAHWGTYVSAHDAAHCAFRYPELGSKLAVQTLGMWESGWERLVPLIRTGAEHELNVHVEWGVYDVRNFHEAWDLRERSRSFAEFLEARGYAVESVEVPDGTDWPAWRNRTGAILESLYPLSEDDRSQ